MKKIFFLCMIVLVGFFAHAQQNSTPEVFIPKPVGTVATGVAYIDNVQINSVSTLTAYIFLAQKDVAGNSVTVKKMITGFISTRPAHWPSEFLVDGTYDPTTMKYLQPKTLPFIFYTQYVKDGDGKMAVEERIFFIF